MSPGRAGERMRFLQNISAAQIHSIPLIVLKAAGHRMVRPLRKDLLALGPPEVLTIPGGQR
jgi:hypothetical protein